MQELFPFMTGFLIGWIAQLIPDRRLRVGALVILCAIFGTIASFISGELSVSWGFLSIDMALVWLGAALSVSLVTGWRRFKSTV